MHSRSWRIEQTLLMVCTLLLGQNPFLPSLLLGWSSVPMAASSSSAQGQITRCSCCHPFRSLVSLEGVGPHYMQAGCRSSSTGVGKSRRWRDRMSRERRVLLCSFQAL